MNPNNSRPMSYDSLKTLLQYSNPNLRFELFRRIPSIRLTEKTVPLRLNSLWIGSHGVAINGTSYEVRNIRHFPPSANVVLFLDNHSPDGDWDLDEWGFDDFSSETVFTPGDLVLQAEGREPRQTNQSEQEKKEIENQLKFDEWMIAKKSGEDVEAEWTGDAVTNTGEALSLTELKHNAEILKLRLAPFNCFENNVPLPFTKMVRVTISSRNGSLCWRYTGNRKCYEIRKQLITWLLGNRKPVIHVNYLSVANGIIARLPENLQISVKKLRTKSYSSDRNSVDTNTMLSKLVSIIHNDNRPLEVFEIDSLFEDFDHPLAANAKKLIVSEDSVMFPSANRLIRIPNQKMHIHPMLPRSHSFYPEGIIRLIRDWIENPREVGKTFSFDGPEKRVIKAMPQIQAAFDGIKTERSINVPVNNISQISVSYESEGFMVWRKQHRLMKIEVVPV